MMMPTSSVRHRRRCIAPATPVDRWTTNSNSFARFGVGITPSILQDGLAKKFIPFFGWREGLTSPHVVLGDPHRVPYIDKGRNSVTPSVMWWDSRIFFWSNSKAPTRQPTNHFASATWHDSAVHYVRWWGQWYFWISSLKFENFGICLKLNSIQILDMNFCRYPLFALLYIWQSPLHPLLTDNLGDFWSFFGKDPKNDTKIFFEAARTSLQLLLSFKTDPRIKKTSLLLDSTMLDFPWHL